MIKNTLIIGLVVLSLFLGWEKIKGDENTKDKKNVQKELRIENKEEIAIEPKNPLGTTPESKKVRICKVKVVNWN